MGDSVFVLKNIIFPLTRLADKRILISVEQITNKSL